MQLGVDPTPQRDVPSNKFLIIKLTSKVPFEARFVFHAKMLVHQNPATTGVNQDAIHVEADQSNGARPFWSQGANHPVFFVENGQRFVHGQNKPDAVQIP